MSQQLATFVASLLGSGVESVEALTIVLAVGLTEGWRMPLYGTAAALGALLALVAVFGTVATHVSDSALKVVIGTLILLFGLRWLHKAVLRSAGVIAMHDEDAAFVETVDELRHADRRRRDAAAFGLAFQGVFLEGVEVVFIVVALGAGAGRLGVAALGALTAAVVVAAAGVVVRHPLARVPENTLKFAVGIVLSSMGTFWAAEGMGTRWPLDLGSLLALIAVYAAGSLAAVAVVRRLAAARPAVAGG